MFNGIKLTDTGASMLAAAQNGGSLKLSRVQIGSGLLPSGATESSVTALVSPVFFLPIAAAEINNNVVSVQFQLINKDITKEFTFREIGLLAIDADGVERLYAYSNAGENAETIPLPSVTIIDYIMSLELAISGNSNITVELDESLTFATKEDFKKTVKNTDVIDIEQGGTGSSTAASARSALGITPANIGAAASDHSHALNGSSITGTLPISKGGTGASTAASARSALGITPANIGAATSGHGHDLTNTEVTGVLPIEKGGTGASTAEIARNHLGISLENLGAADKDHTHALDGDAIKSVLPVTKGGTGANTAAGARTALGITPENLGAAEKNHSHVLTNDEITGNLPISKGGTGAGTAESARTALGITPANIGAATSDHSHELSDSTHITGVLPVHRGGTGANSAAAARESLKITPANIGAANKDHSHFLQDDETKGILPIEKGGTGAITAAQARSFLGVNLANLGAAPADHSHEVTLDDDEVTGVLPISKGGTGGTIAESARANLGIELIENPVKNTAAEVAYSAMESGVSLSGDILYPDRQGLYLIGVNGLFDNSGAGFRRLRILVDGVTIAETTQRPIENVSHSQQCIVAHTVKSYERVTFQAYQSSGSTLAFKARTWAVRLCT